MDCARSFLGSALVVLIATSACSRAGMQSEPLFTLSGLELVPDPLVEGASAAQVLLMAGNSDPRSLTVLGSRLSVDKNGSAGTQVVAFADNPVAIAASSSALFQFELRWSPPLAAADVVTISAELAARFDGSNELVAAASDQPRSWTVAPPVRPDAALPFDASGRDLVGVDLAVADRGNPNQDSDSDGLTDQVERAIGTHTDQADSDGDTLDDPTEVGPDPAHPRDSDGDGVIDALETDSDDGGEGDRSETLGHRDPTNASDDLVGTTLTVTSADDELDGPSTMVDPGEAGGADDLSLREAMTIANNRTGPDTILFAPAVFPAGAPTTIQVGTTGLGELPWLSDLGTAIDASGAGVIIDGGGTAGDLGTAFGIEADRCRLANLTARNFRYHSSSTCVGVYNAEDVVIDGLRVECDGPETKHGLYLLSANRATIANSDFGYGHYGITVEGTGQVRLLDSVVHDFAYHCVRVSGSTLGSFERIGVYRCGAGLSFTDSSAFDIVDSTLENHHGTAVQLENWNGPLALRRNVVRFNVGSGVWVSYYSEVPLLSQNLFAANGGPGIDEEWGDLGVRVAVPELTAYQAGAVDGTSTLADGAIIELFVDAADEGELYLGSTTVTAGTFHLPVALPPTLPGRNFTATATDGEDRTSEFSAPLAF